MTLQINKIKPPNEPRRVNRVKKFPLILTKCQTLAPHQTILVECQLENACQDMEKTTGIVIPAQEFEENCEIAFTSSISDVPKKNLLLITAFNITDHHITLPFKSKIGKFFSSDSDGSRNLFPIEPKMIAFAKTNHSDNIEMDFNELIEQSWDNQRPQIKHEPEYEKLWFPTPETGQNPELLLQNQRDIHERILHFQGLEKLRNLNLKQNIK